MAANQADTDAPLDTSGAGAVPYLSYPVPGIAHGAIPGLLGVALNGQAPPAADEGGRKTITAEDLRNQLYREHGRPTTFARRFDAWPAVSPTRGGDIPAAPPTADFGAPPQVGAPPPQQSPDAQPPDAPPPGATPVSHMFSVATIRSPAQNAAEARFVEQMGRYGALGSRMLATGHLRAPRRRPSTNKRTKRARGGKVVGIVTGKAVLQRLDRPTRRRRRADGGAVPGASREELDAHHGKNSTRALTRSRHSAWEIHGFWSSPIWSMRMAPCDN